MEADLRAIVIGGSAGALDALAVILPEMPAGYPVPILVVIHLPPDTKSAVPEMLRSDCRVKVREAEDKELAIPWCVYFAPPDYHLLVESDGRLSLSSDEPVRYSRPSIDVLFESAADACGAALVGVVLSGGNADGAAGLRAIAAAGGLAVVQRPDTAQSEAMPRAALAACPGARALSPADIAALLRSF